MKAKVGQSKSKVGLKTKGGLSRPKEVLVGQTSLKVKLGLSM